MLANAIGVYKGAPNIDEFFNTKSFLNYDDYGNNKALINKIMELDQDDRKYQAMLDEPLFMNNELPLRVKKAKEELTKFLLKIIK